MARVPSDYELALRVRDGNEWAFDELVRRHRDVIHFNANQFHLPGAEQEDVEQMALVGLLKAARTFRPDRGSGFRNFIGLAIKSELITALKTATRVKHQPLSRSVRFEMPVRQPAEEEVEYGDLLPADPDDDPCEVVIRRETLWGHLQVLHGCSEIEQTVAARVLKGCSLAEAGKGLGLSAMGPAKVADNALCRVRRKLAAAA